VLDSQGLSGFFYLEGAEMQEELSPFNYGTNQVRAIAVEGEPWFCASDVCDILGYTNANKAVKDHCKPDGVTNRYPIHDSLGRIQHLRHGSA
jgi:prophage antirepressor-like protein